MLSQSSVSYSLPGLSRFFFYSFPHTVLGEISETFCIIQWCYLTKTEKNHQQIQVSTTASGDMVGSLLLPPPSSFFFFFLLLPFSFLHLSSLPHLTSPLFLTSPPLFSPHLSPHLSPLLLFSSPYTTSPTQHLTSGFTVPHKICQILTVILPKLLIGFLVMMYGSAFIVRSFSYSFSLPPNN